MPALEPAAWRDQHIHRVARVPSATVDALAAFEAGDEDRESDKCDEPQVDDEPSIWPMS